MIAHQAVCQHPCPRLCANVGEDGQKKSPFIVIMKYQFPVIAAGVCMVNGTGLMLAFRASHRSKYAGPPKKVPFVVGGAGRGKVNKSTTGTAGRRLLAVEGDVAEALAEGLGGDAAAAALGGGGD